MRRLMREFARQAFLVAARDEFGIVALDGTLRETVPTNASVIHAALLVRIADGNWSLKLFVFDESDEEHQTEGLWDSKPIWEYKFPIEKNVRIFYGKAVDEFQKLSRKQFMEALQLAGFTKRADHFKKSEPVPQSSFEKWESELSQVDFVSHYSVIRSVHEAIREQGHSAELLGILIRAYANLSILTQHQWNAATEVFAARALIYGQRIVLE